ncbi:MAG TPA: DUF1800 domain-containing protein [Pseudomonadales bacterium]|nr:DUF1800 domain-containing protein [Pseudomonadales bacterium]
MMTFKPFHAAARFGLGGSRKDLAAIGARPDDWVMAQVESKADMTVTGIADSRSQLIAYQKFAIANREARQSRETDVEAFKMRQQTYRHGVRDRVLDQLSKRFSFAVTTDNPVKERFAQFWSNHFTVSRANKPQISALCAAFENEAIRPMLDQHFTEMLLKVAAHPAMLMYLDNFQSVGPNSIAGRRRRLGINENFAREVMELHTVGVDGGYTQQDVQSLARILTGWTIGNDRLVRFGAKPGEFAFSRLLHEPGPQTLLGKSYPESGVKQGIDALTDLSLNPATATHIATKLVTHFVSDTPSAADIGFVANVFRKSDGHLPSVHKAVVSLTSAWRGESRKLKTPYELLVSTWRGLTLPVDRFRPVIGVLRDMNDIPFSAPSPAGWPDSAEAWGAPAMIKERVEWGIAAGRKLGNYFNPMEAAKYIVDPDAELLLASIRRAESPAQGLSILLSSPDFQWR